MLLIWTALCLAATLSDRLLVASAPLVDYTFSNKQVSNPDGSLKINLPGDTQLVDGPGNFQGQSLPKAARVGFSGPIDTDISTKTIKDTSRFHIRVVFSIDKGFDDRAAPKMLVESSRLPFQLGLYGQADSMVKLAGAVRSSTVKWRSTETYSTPSIKPGKWYAADLVYDTDTLVVFLDGKAISCHGFGQNGVIAFDALKKSIFIGGQALQNRFSSGKIAAFMLETTVPSKLESLVDEQRQTTQWYITTKLESNRLTVDLGRPTGPPIIDIDTMAWVQTYTAGAIMYHSAASSAFEIYGQIWKRYKLLPKSTKRSLGFLASDQIPSTKASGRKSVFRGGAIYWSPNTPALEVLDQIYLQYEATGEASEWGFPLELAQTISGGLTQRMQHAVFYYKNGAPSAHEVHGVILQAFRATGGIAKWGWPVSDEIVVEGLRDCPPASGGGPSLCFPRNVRLSEFENASFYWSAATGAHNIYGHIRTKWLDIGGPTSPLGLPTTDELDIPGGGRQNRFEKGAITWHGSLKSVQIVRPFKLYIGVLDTQETEGWLMGQNDLYFRVTIKKGNSQVFQQRFPGSGDFGNRNVKNFDREVGPVLNPSGSISFTIDVWESDNGAPFGGGDDHIGTWTKTLDASNAWGLRENQGIFNSGKISKIKSITAAVHPEVDLATLTEDDKFFGADNIGTDPVSYQAYAEAFRDVDSSPESYDPLDWLDKLFYELVIKHMASNGRCFGMSIEAINARKGGSIFSMPINRFTSWDVIGHVMTVKQLYQVGAGSIWFFVGQFLSGNTHNPIDVFNDSERSFLRGNPTTLNLAQKYKFDGAPHSVMPYAWDRSVNPHVIKIHDPSIPGELRDVKVDFDTNTFSYDNGNAYKGGQWSGGRLYYTPWSVVDSPPRTPIWDSIVLLLAGTVVIMGSDTETTSITNARDEDLNAHGSRATTALKEKRSLDGYFVNAAVTMGEDAPTEMLFSRGATSNIVLPRIPSPSVKDPEIAPRDYEPLDDIEKRALPSLTSKTFKQTIRGKPGARTHQHFIKVANTHVAIKSPISRGESVSLAAEKLNTMQAGVSFKHAGPKTHEVNLMHRLGMSRDSVRMQLNLTTGAGGTFKLSPRPGLTLLDLDPGATKMKAAKLTLTVAKDLKSSTYSFDLMQLAGKDGVLKGPVRVKLTAGSRAGNVTVATLDASGAIVGSKRAVGVPVAVDRSTGPDPGPEPPL